MVKGVCPAKDARKRGENYLAMNRTDEKKSIRHVGGEGGSPEKKATTAKGTNLTLGGGGKSAKLRTGGEWSKN